MTALPFHTQTFWTGLVVAIVGFFSSFPIFLAGVEAMGASPTQAASAVMAGSISMGLAAIVLSLRYRVPASVAWSTPGAAFLAVSAPDAAGFAGAVGAFIIAGVLGVISGFWKPLARLAAAIPAPITMAMLSGVLLSICLVPFKALPDAPMVALPIIVTWFIVGRFSRLFAVPAAVVTLFLLVLWHNSGLPQIDTVVTDPVFVWPVFSLSAALGLGVPLFIVTMATQNLPGVSVLRANGYEPPAGRLFATVGAFSVLSAPWGAASTCVAAITAAMCCDENAHPDKSQRYMAAVWAGVFYCVFGVFAAGVTNLAGLAPPLAMGVLAGVALFNVFANSAAAAISAEETREEAALTFVVTASGITLFGLGAAVWGLLIGCLVHVIKRRLAS
ncbi:Inner membrane protein YdcO [Pelagimonas phthalicica]|uniref:Inner membrane protein YdcO n=1 Tax=Pelagimonas phthalicica TaxID=1037362 RepID=A0A238JGV8_9RHOB|nr:benzoate/H(+) symporter BenE family transporter [Pelagimonas phthalicica]TDS89150.1 benzoate membrane transport protein [Pelagimonas phthalicica]SMX29675.1 Inner membrane protein YdcO [Pelagimonas phthalicica]